MHLAVIRSFVGLHRGAVATVCQSLQGLARDTFWAIGRWAVGVGFDRTAKSTGHRNQLIVFGRPELVTISGVSGGDTLQQRARASRSWLAASCWLPLVNCYNN